MKNRLAALILTLACALPLSAAERIICVINVTNNAETGDTLVINGDTRIFTNATAAATIATNALGTSAGVATNVFDAAAEFFFTSPRLYPKMTNETSIQFRGPWGGSLAASQTGNWCDISLYTNSSSNAYTMAYPLSALAADVATNQATNMMIGLRDYSPIAFSTNCAVLSNYWDVGPDTHSVAAGKVITGGGAGMIISNFVAHLNSGSTGTNMTIHTLIITNGANVGSAFQSIGTGSGSEQFGANASATAASTLAVGELARASATGASAIGSSSDATAQFASAFGESSGATGTNAVAVGKSSAATGYDSIALGTGTAAQGSNCVIIGSGVTNPRTNDITLGGATMSVTIPGILDATISTNLHLKGSNTITGSLAYTPTTISTVADGNNVLLISSDAVIVELTGTVTADCNINAITNSTGQWNGRTIRLINSLGFTMSLIDESGYDASPDNRIDTGGTGADVAIPNKGAVNLVYGVPTASRWNIVNAYPVSSFATNAIAQSGGNATNLNVYGFLNLADANVTHVPLDGDIQTYIDAALSGDTLILASGTYDITNSLTITNEINIVGMGESGLITVPVMAGHGTLLQSPTNGLVLFRILTNNVRISDMSMSLTGDGATAIDVTNNLAGIVLSDLDIIINGAGQNRAATLRGSDVLVNNFAFYVVSTDDLCSGLWVLNDSDTTQNATVKCRNVTGTVQGAATYAAGFVCENLNDGNTITLQLDNSVCTALSGTPIDVAVATFSTTTFNSVVNAYLCTLDGADYDVYNAAGNTLTVGGSVLVNNLVLGTPTYRGAVVSGSATVSNLVMNAGMDISSVAIYPNENQTNFVVDFDYAERYIDATNNIHLAGSTNLPAAGYVRYQNITIWTGATNWNFSATNVWNAMGTPLPSLLPSNSYVEVSIKVRGVSETNVLIGVTGEP